MARRVDKFTRSGREPDRRLQLQKEAPMARLGDALDAEKRAELARKAVIAEQPDAQRRKEEAIKWRREHYTRTAIYEWLTQYPGNTIAVVARELEIDREQVGQVMNLMAHEGHLTYDRTGKFRTSKRAQKDLQVELERKSREEQRERQRQEANTRPPRQVSDYTPAPVPGPPQRLSQRLPSAQRVNTPARELAERRRLLQRLAWLMQRIGQKQVDTIVPTVMREEQVDTLSPHFVPAWAKRHHTSWEEVKAKRAPTVKPETKAAIEKSIEENAKRLADPVVYYDEDYPGVESQYDREALDRGRKFEDQVRALLQDLSSNPGNYTINQVITRLNQIVG